VLALKRALVRRDALRLAGQRTPPHFAPLVAITALAVASRMAFLALPNLKPTFAIVFLGGVLFGPGLGALAGLLAMALTDLLLTGLSVAPFANAPAMALVGLLGGLLRGWSKGDAWGVRVAAAVCGILGTVAFSVAADVLTWLVVAELRDTPGALQGLVVQGLAFNVVPAIANALLFAAAVGPVARAVRAAGLVDAGQVPRVPREALVG
jgi:uncharacterized membrane protein